MKCIGCFLDVSSEVLGNTVAKHWKYDEIWHIKCYHNRFGGKISKVDKSLDGTMLNHWEERVTKWLIDKKRFTMLLEDFDGDEDNI